jgi:hypothetical protein
MAVERGQPELRSIQGATTYAPDAAAPAGTPPSRRATRKAITTPAMAPARATNSHRSGARLPKSANGVVSSTGNGFHDGPSTVDRSRCRISRPQTIQAHGS